MVKSAGTENSALVKVSKNLLQWADKVFVMEEKHRFYLQRNYSDIVAKKEIIVLGIEDEYMLMDPELIELLHISVRPFINPE